MEKALVIGRGGQGGEDCAIGDTTLISSMCALVRGGIVSVLRVPAKIDAVVSFQRQGKKTRKHRIPDCTINQNQSKFICVVAKKALLIPFSLLCFVQDVREKRVSF